jgi:DNA-binding response OmpR family regulator
MRILLVEDEPSLVRYIKKGLEEEGYAVDAATDGQQALAASEVAVYDTIILDIMIPRVDGIEVCRRIRARGASGSILMLTARDAIEDRVAGLDAGADDYLVKPFAFEELLARIRALSRRSLDTPRSPVLKVADLSLDTVTKKASRGALSIDLTAKEYAILEYMMRQPGRVFTRDQIADHVWDSHSFNESNVVDVYIRNLRRKIDDPCALKLFETLRGLGYRMAAEVHHEKGR